MVYFLSSVTDVTVVSRLKTDFLVVATILVTGAFELVGADSLWNTEVRVGRS